MGRVNARRGSAPRDRPPMVEREATDHAAARRSRLVRRVIIGGFVVFVALGLCGLLGYREADVTARGDGYELHVDYPQITRGGLPTRWTATVTRTDGSPLPAVTLRINTAHLDLFDHNLVLPTPAETWQDDEWTTWDYDAVGEPTLAVVLDMRTQPNVRWHHPARVELLVEDHVVAAVAYHTTVLP